MSIVKDLILLWAILATLAFLFLLIGGWVKVMDEKQDKAIKARVRELDLSNDVEPPPDYELLTCACCGVEAPKGPVDYVYLYAYSRRTQVALCQMCCGIGVAPFVQRVAEVLMVSPPSRAGRTTEDMDEGFF